MAVHAGEHCATCGAADLAGEVRFGRLFRKFGERWREGPPGDAMGLCARCLTFMHDTMSNSLATSPAADNAASALRRNCDNSCDYCDAEISVEAYSIEIIPLMREYVSRGGRSGYLVKHVGDIRKQRVCYHCYLWVMSCIDDPSAILGESFRAGDGPRGEWTWEVMTDVSSLNLSRSDTKVLRGTAEAMGQTQHSLRAADLQNPEAPKGDAIFLGSGNGRRASKLLEAMPQALREKTVLVARIDSVDEAERCLALGVRDLLVSPLSPHQVVGAIERIWPHKGFVTSRLGQPRNSLLLTPRQPKDKMLLRLTLRRFLRGFDRIEPEGDNLRLSVYCPDDQVPAVIRRLEMLLGSRAQIRQVRAPREQAA